MEKAGTKIDTMEKLFHVTFFAVAFVLMGKFIPEIYYQYFDKTKYYTIEVPVLIDKMEYRACDTLVMEVRRNSLVDVDAKSYLEMVLIRSNGSDMEVSRLTREIVLEKGQSKVGVPLPIPCDSVPGEYFYRGIVSFTINGVDKDTPFHTTGFNVIY